MKAYVKKQILPELPAYIQNMPTVTNLYKVKPRRAFKIKLSGVLSE